MAEHPPHAPSSDDAHLAHVAHREHQRRSRIGALIARGHFADASAALGVCWPEEQLPHQLRAALVRGKPANVTAFLEQFWAEAPQHFAIPTADLEIPPRHGFAELVLLLRVDPAPEIESAADTDTDTDAIPGQLSPVIELSRTHLLDMAIGRATTAEQAPSSLASARARAVALGDPPLGGSKRSTLILWADRGNPMIELLASAGRAIGDDILGPLSEHSDEALTLRRALRAYLATGGRANQTAQELGVHRNTLRNRLERIERLTGCSLASADDRAELWMALRLVTDGDPRPSVGADSIF